MRTRLSPTKLLVCAGSLMAAACGGDGATAAEDSGSPMIEDDQTPANPGCGDAAHGDVERRVRYQAASVEQGQQCLEQNQMRTCEAGTWSDWSGDYVAESCEVVGKASCGDTPHGNTEERERYRTASVAFGETCEKESQSRTCDDGNWSDWSGTHAEPACTVQGASDCDGKPHGEAETRTRYSGSSVPFGSTCQSEQQTRGCDDGAWSDWTGSFSEEGCVVQDAASCGDTPHGGSEQRVRFQASSAAECTSETQVRSCDDGNWGDWSGTFSAEFCDVIGNRRCGDVAHGAQATRSRYLQAEVAYGETCAEEAQVSTCDDGTLGDWTGTYTEETCTVAEPADCEGGAHGSSQTQTFFESATVPFGSACSSQEQSRTCTNGTWSEWSGDFEQETCTVAEPADCEGGAHGSSQDRTRFEAANVPFGGSCSSEEQSRTCTNGTWSEWSGDFEQETCTVAEPADCEGGAHGSSQDRTRFEAANVPFGGSCSSEEQSRTCTNGTWSEWSGDFEQETCTVAEPADCEGGAHGSSQDRTRFEAANVPFGGSCSSEEQSRTCTNGTWSDWSGSFQQEICTVAEPADCEGGAHGSSQTQTFFESATVPFGSTCSSQEQSRTCTNGTWSEWSGDFRATSCEILPPASCDGVAHGGTRERTRYRTASVPFGQTCDEETQVSTCNDGDWGPYSGNFTQLSCTVQGPASCDGQPHGTTENRTRYAEAAVLSDETCDGEEQERTCNDGQWSGWSGSYEEENCYRIGVDCTDPLTGEVTLNGETRTRTFYQIAFPDDDCVSEQADSQCVDGVFSAWGGNYWFVGCAPRTPPEDDVASCMSVTSIEAGAYWPLCTDWTGPNADTFAAQACGEDDLLDLDRACPDTGTFYGRCVFPLGDDGTTSAYAYEEGYGESLKDVCAQNGAVWEGP